MSHGDRRKALIVGIDDYKEQPLSGAENDANAISKLLSKHEKMDPNFECLTFGKSNPRMTGDFFRSLITDLLSEEVDIALLYFSGHGLKTDSGLALVAADFPEDTSEIELAWIMDLIQKSPAEEVFLILDCCFSGGAGDLPDFEAQTSLLRKGVTILAASSHSSVATESSGHGKFTRLLCRGLEGAAIDMVGHVTSSSLYAYADSFLSLWEQKPVYKAHVSGLTALRYCYPKLAKKELRQVVEFFPKADDTLPLDSSYLPGPDSNTKMVKKFRILKRLRRHGFVEGTHSRILSWEAGNGGGCRLTESGKDLHQLVRKNKI